MYPLFLAVKVRIHLALPTNRISARLTGRHSSAFLNFVYLRMYPVFLAVAWWLLHKEHETLSCNNVFDQIIQLYYWALYQQVCKSYGTLKLLCVERSTYRLLWNWQGLTTQPKIFPYHLRRSTNASLLKRPSNCANAWDGRRFSSLTLAQMAVAKKHLDYTKWCYAFLIYLSTRKP